MQFHRLSLGILAVAFSTAVSGTTLIWDLTTNDGGSTQAETFLSTQGGIPITVYKFSSLCPSSLLASDDQRGEELDIPRDGFLQLNISALAGLVTTFIFQLESPKTTNSWQILASDSLGHEGTTPVLSGSGGGIQILSGLPSFNYLSFVAPSGDVRVGPLIAETGTLPRVVTLQEVPDSLPWLTVGSGLVCIGIIRLRNGPFPPFR